ncbi:uncharacterized protein G2W53_039480 [Senna tora]|uniref:Retrotransposon Copia-like N-terminal domain-containing protein n=1 Tax=Senna tora TaxID=362788 RepID=A0A834W801_9FABA|nr:uncharacterized protein G2W53_039480 [Senna tora]
MADESRSLNTIFDEGNYVAWSIAVLTALEAKDKTGFLDDSILAPTDPTEFKKWKKVDSMIKLWMVNSLSKEHSDYFGFCITSRALWNTLQELFGTNNVPQIYCVQRQTISLAQGGDFVTAYFNKINRCWDEMGRLMPLPTYTCGKCSCNLAKKVVDLDASIKLMQFLMGLNPLYDVIRTHILNLDPTPSDNKAYNIVIIDEKQKQLNMIFFAPIEGASALMAKTSQGKDQKSKAILAKGAALGNLYYLNKNSFCNPRIDTVNDCKVNHAGSSFTFQSSNSDVNNNAKVLSEIIYDTELFFKGVTWTFLLQEKTQMDASKNPPKLPISLEDYDTTLPIGTQNAEPEIQELDPNIQNFNEDELLVQLEPPRFSTRQKRALVWMQDYVCMSKASEILEPYTYAQDAKNP